MEISSLCFSFINQDPGNKIKALTSGKRQREIGLNDSRKFQRTNLSKGKINFIRSITVLPTYSQSKGKQTMKIGQLIQYNRTNIFLQKSCRK